MGDSAVLAHVVRGSVSESVHRGHIAVVDPDGRIVMSWGDPSTVTFWRSAAKPIQAVPLVTSGALAHFGFSEAELAVMTGSHSGCPEHLTTVEAILAKIGTPITALACGPSQPLDPGMAAILAAAGQQPTSLHNNCSGKHAAMLSLAAHLGEPADGYWLPEHRVQQALLDQVCQITGLPRSGVAIGVDGCGVPVFGLPVSAMARAFARLAVAPAGSSEHTVAVAMMHHPLMVSGPGRLCTQLMEALPGRIVAKGGAEGVYCYGLPQSGLGVAVKVEDGSGRALGPIVFETLKALGVLSEQDEAALAFLSRVPTMNARCEEVGSIGAAIGRQRRSLTEAETVKIGEELGHLLEPGDVVCLYGDIGAGKTHFAQGVGRGLGVRADMTSPTFAFINEYGSDTGARHPLLHADLYRLDAEGDAAEIGIDEYLGADWVSVVEWADRAPSYMPRESLGISLKELADGSRVISFAPRGARYQKLCEVLSARAIPRH